MSYYCYITKNIKIDLLFLHDLIICFLLLINVDFIVIIIILHGS